MTTKEKIKVLKNTFIGRHLILFPKYMSWEKNFMVLMKMALCHSKKEFLEKNKAPLFFPQELEEFYEAVLEIGYLPEFLTDPKILEMHELQSRLEKMTTDEIKVEFTPKLEPYENFVEASKLPLVKNITKEELHSLIDEVRENVLYFFLEEKQKEADYNVQELKDFYWAVTRVEHFKVYPRISKNITDTVLALIEAPWEIEEAIFEALNRSFGYFRQNFLDISMMDLFSFYNLVHKERELFE